MNLIYEPCQRQETGRREQVLDATQEDIRELAQVVEAMMKAEQICVIGSEDKIEENSDMFENVTSF